MASGALQEEIHDDDNEIDDEGSLMFATPSANFQDTTPSSFHQANTDMSQNMYGSSEYHDYIAEQLASIGLSVDDELMALNLMVEKPSNIRAFKALWNDRDRKLTYVWMLLREHERRGGV
ncbi:hypothetical protein AB3S75_012840 [Citrus x aurantiifolia]